MADVATVTENTTSLQVILRQINTIHSLGVAITTATDRQCKGRADKNVADYKSTNSLFSGVAGPLAAQGGGQICRPFVLGF